MDYPSTTQVHPVLLKHQKFPSTGGKFPLFPVPRQPWSFGHDWSDNTN